MNVHKRMIQRGTGTVQSPPKWAMPVLIFVLGFVCGILLCILSGCTLVEYGEAKYLSLGGRSFDKLTITKDPNSITVEVINYEKKSPILVIEIPGAKIKSGGGQ